MDSNATQAESEPQPPSLPTEIVHRIIQLALPRVSFKTFGERCSTLLGFMLVDQRWRELAQREMLRHVLLNTEQQVDLLLSVDREPSHLSSPTKSLWFNEHFQVGTGWNFLACESMRKAISICTHVEMISVLAANTSAAVLDIDLLAEGVKEIKLDGCSLAPTPSTSLVARDLRRITLSWLPSTRSYTSLLSLSLPSLEQLALILADQYIEIEDLASILLEVKRLAPQLRSFAYATAADSVSDLPVPDNLWDSFNVLEKLSIDLHMPICASMLSLPALRTLRLRSGGHPSSPSQSAAIAAFDVVLRSHPSPWEFLVRIGLPSADEDVDDEEIKDEQEAREQVLNWCRERSIEIFKSAQYFVGDDYRGDLENALDFWCALAPRSPAILR